MFYICDGYAVLFLMVNGTRIVSAINLFVVARMDDNHLYELIIAFYGKFQSAIEFQIMKPYFIVMQIILTNIKKLIDRITIDEFIVISNIT